MLIIKNCTYTELNSWKLYSALNDTGKQNNHISAEDKLIVFWKQAIAGIGLHVNAQKTEYINQTGNISTLDGTSLKLVDKFTYIGSSVSSTEKDIDTRLTKAWTAIDKLRSIRSQQLLKNTASNIEQVL